MIFYLNFEKKGAAYSWTFTVSDSFGKGLYKCTLSCYLHMFIAVKWYLEYPWPTHVQPYSSGSSRALQWSVIPWRLQFQFLPWTEFVSVCPCVDPSPLMRLTLTEMNPMGIDILHELEAWLALKVTFSNK